MNDNWGIGRCYEKIINTQFKKDGYLIDNKFVIENFNAGIEYFVLENS